MMCTYFMTDKSWGHQVTETTLDIYWHLLPLTDTYWVDKMAIYHLQMHEMTSLRKRGDMAMMMACNDAEYRAACHGRSLLLLLPVAWGECTRNVTVWPDSGHTVTLRVRGESGPDSWTYDSPLCNDGKKPNE